MAACEAEAVMNKWSVSIAIAGAKTIAGRVRMAQVLHVGAGAR